MVNSWIAIRTFNYIRMGDGAQVLPPGRSVVPVSAWHRSRAGKKNPTKCVHRSQRMSPNCRALTRWCTDLAHSRGCQRRRRSWRRRRPPAPSRPEVAGRAGDEQRELGRAVPVAGGGRRPPDSGWPACPRGPARCGDSFGFLRYRSGRHALTRRFHALTPSLLPGTDGHLQHVFHSCTVYHVL